MKETINVGKENLQKVQIDKTLDKYDDVVLFPNQVKRAKEMFEHAGGINKLTEVIKKFNSNQQ